MSTAGVSHSVSNVTDRKCQLVGAPGVALSFSAASWLEIAPSVCVVNAGRRRERRRLTVGLQLCFPIFSFGISSS